MLCANCHRGPPGSDVSPLDGRVVIAISEEADMNQASVLVTMALGRIGQARRRRRLEIATKDLTEHALKDIGLRRNGLGHIERRSPEYF